jgi:hypothetical protein
MIFQNVSATKDTSLSGITAYLFAVLVSNSTRLLINANANMDLRNFLICVLKDAE